MEFGGSSASARSAAWKAILFVPTVRRERSVAAVAAVGRLIDTLYLGVSVLIAAVIAVACAKLVMGFNAGRVALFGLVAGGGEPVMVLRSGQGRYRNRF